MSNDEEEPYFEPLPPTVAPANPEASVSAGEHPMHIKGAVREPDPGTIEKLNADPKWQVDPQGQPSAKVPAMDPANDGEYFEPLPSPEEKRAQRDAKLKDAYEKSLHLNPDTEAKVLRLSKDLQVPRDVVEGRFDFYQNKWAASQFDAEAWRKSTPIEMVRLADNDPRLAPLVAKVARERTFDALTKAWNWAGDVLADAANLLGQGEIAAAGGKLDQKEIDADAASTAAARVKRDTPWTQEYLHDASVSGDALDMIPARYREVRDETTGKITTTDEVIEPAHIDPSGLTRTLKIGAGRYEEAGRGDKVALLGWQLMQARFLNNVADGTVRGQEQGDLRAVFDRTLDEAFQTARGLSKRAAAVVGGDAADMVFNKTLDEVARTVRGPGKRAAVVVADTADLQKQIATLEADNLPRDYNENATEMVVADVAEGVQSQVSILTETGIPMAVAYGAGAVVGAVTKTGAKRIGKLAASIVGKVALARAVLMREGGSMYNDLGKARTDDGLEIPEEVRRGGALLYGGLAAVSELWSEANLIRSFTGAGKALASREARQEFQAALIHNPKMRALAAEAAKVWIKTAGGEGFTEGIQSLEEDATKYLTQSVAATKVDPATGELPWVPNWQEPPSAAGVMEKAFVSARKAGVSTLAIGAGPGAVHIHSVLAQVGESRAMGPVAAAYAGLPNDTPLVVAAPKEVAEMIAVATAKNGRPTTHLYVDPEAFTRLFQSQKDDVNEAATQLMGPEGPRLLQEAIDTQTKLEVPSEQYLTRWGGTETAKALANDTTTHADLLTTNEQKAAEPLITKEVQEYLKGQQALLEAPTEPDEVEFVAQLENRLKTMKGYTASGARAAVSIWRGFARTMAQRNGQTLSEAFKGIQVVLEDMSGLNPEEKLRERVRTLSQAERAKELYTDANTGTLDETAHKEMTAPADRPLTGHVSVEGIKYSNDKFSHEKADVLYRAVARALHAVDPGVRFINGDFAVNVKDRAHLAQIVEQVKALMPEDLRGFDITGAVGKDFKEAAKEHGVQKTAAEEAGKRAKPRPGDDENGVPLPPERPLGLKADPKFEHVDPVALKIPEHLAKAAAALTDEQYFDKTYRDPVTGAWTAKAWKVLERKAAVAAFDLAGLKLANQDFGEEAGDRFILRIKQAAKLAGGEDFDFTHLHGDEYAAQHDNPEALDVFVQTLYKVLAELHETEPLVETHLESGKSIRYQVQLRHGFGQWTYESADLDLNKRKIEQRKADAAANKAAAVDDPFAGPPVAQEAGGRSGEGDVGGERGGHHGPGNDERGSGSGVGQGNQQAVAPEVDLKAEAQKVIGRMRPKNKAQAQAWFDYCEKVTTERPTNVNRDVKLLLARYDVVDPTGFDYGAESRATKKRDPNAKGSGTRSDGYRRYKSSNTTDLEKYRRERSGEVFNKFFKQLMVSPSERVLYQFPTPEESLAAMERETVLRDMLQEMGAKVVSSVDALIDGMRARAAVEHPGAKAVHYSVYTRPSARPEGAQPGSRVHDFDSHITAEAFIRANAGHVEWVHSFSPGEMGDQEAALRGERFDIEHRNQEKRRAQGLFGSSERFGDVASASAKEAGVVRSTLPHRLLIERDRRGEHLEEGGADIPASKNLPGQGSLERSVDVWRLEQPGDEPVNPRGYVHIMGKPGRPDFFRIALGKNADMSTFLHESGHVFMELMGNFAQEENAPKGIKEDYDAVLKWLGATERETLTVEQLEKFARGFETYLREGKPPSAAMKGPFQRFKLWLTKIYRLQSLLNVDINDDIRGVFDRLLATDDEIAAQKAKTPDVFKSAKEAGLTDEQWQGYLKARERATSDAQHAADLRAAKDKLRETEAWWKEEERQQREKFQAQYDELPARIAQKLLRGQDADGWMGVKVALSREVVEAAVGKEAAKKFRLAKDGQHPDVLAEQLGYPTGAELLKAVLALPEQDAWVSEKVDAHMQEAHPDVVQDRQLLREEVAKGLHGQVALSSLVDEWKQLGLRSGLKRHVAAEAMKRAAKQIAEGRTVGRLNVQATLQAERKAASNAAIAAAKGNFEQALVFKQQQVLNAHLYRELLQARDDRDDFAELATSLDKNEARAKLGKASPVYRDGVAMILEALGLVESEQGREEPLPSLNEVVSQIEDDGGTVMFDVEKLGALLAQPREWQTLTVEQMREVDSALRNIKGVANAVGTVLLDGKRVDKAQLIADLMADAIKNLPNLGPIASSKSAEGALSRLSGGIASADGSLLKPELLAEWLAGGDQNSPWFRAIIKPLQDAKAREVDLLNSTIKPIIDAFEKMPPAVLARWNELINGKALFPGHAVAFDQNLSPPSKRFELLMMALNAGNESNLQRLLEGRNITAAQLTAALDLLTKEELDWVQTVWDANESLWPLAADLEERDSGLRPPKVAARPLVTRHGTYRGGYFSLVYDKRVEAAGERQAAGQLADLLDPSFTRPGTSRGHLKGRVQNFAAAVSLDPATISRHLAQAAHDIAFREAIKSVGGIILNPQIQATLKARLGEGRSKVFLQWLKDVGQMRAADGSQHVEMWDKSWRAIRGNTAVHALGYSLPNMVEDITNAFLAVVATDLKVSHWAAGFLEFMSNPLNIFEKARGAEARSGELRTRRDQNHRELVNQIDQIFSGPVARRWKPVKRHAFVLLELTDRLITTPVWLGGYRQAIAEGRNDADAVTYADSLIRKLFPSHSAVDQSAILRNKGFIGQTLMFHGFMNTVWNRLRASAHPLHIAEGPAAKAKAFVPVSASIFAIMNVVGPLSAIFRGQGPEKDEEWWKWYMRKLLLSGGLSLLPGGGDVTAALESFVLHKRTNVRNMSIGGIAANVTAAAIDSAISDKESRVKVENLLRATGPLTGIPISQPARTLGFLYDWEEGNIDVRVPGDVIGGLVYGQNKSEAKNIPVMIQDAISGNKR